MGLWCMRSTATAPANPALLYAELQRDARLAESLGFNSLWLSEHHFWYDGWCPSLPVAGAAVLGATEHLGFGTGVLLLPLHDPDRLADAGLALHELAPGRTELAVGLGYRDAEFDGFGRRRRARGRAMDCALSTLEAAWTDGGPDLLVGGISDRALRRAQAHGLGIFLPSTTRTERLSEIVGRARDEAARDGRELGRVGVLKSAWVTRDNAAEVRRARAAIGEQTREYGGAWWLLDGQLGLSVPDLLDAQVERAAQTAIVGPGEVVATELRELEAAGVDLVVLHVATDESRPHHRACMEAIASDVLPLLA